MFSIVGLNPLKPHRIAADLSLVCRRRVQVLRRPVDQRPPLWDTKFLNCPDVVVIYAELSMLLFDSLDVRFVEVIHFEGNRPASQHEHPCQNSIEKHRVQKMQRSEANNVVELSGSLCSS